MKKRIKSSEQAQVIEDALCMVFLEHQLPDFRKQKGDDDKVWGCGGGLKRGQTWIRHRFPMEQPVIKIWCWQGVEA